MAWVRQLSDGTYKGAYRDAHGKRKTVPGVYRHKKAAERAAEAKEQEARHTREKDNPLTWREWSKIWIPQRDIAPGTAETDKQRIDSHVMPRWGDVKLTDITRAEVKEWVTELRGVPDDDDNPERAASTVNRIAGLLSTSLEQALDSEYIAVNPARGIRLKTGEETHDRYLTKAEVRRICEHLSPRWQNITNLLAYTGLRWGEAVGLSDRRVSRSRGILLVAEVWDQKTEQMKKYPKGKKRRSVPVPDWVLENLPTVDPLLPSPRGARPGNRNFQRALDDAAKVAKIERFRVHDLRHTYASWLIQAGVPIEEVRRLMGHVSIQTTQRYAHLAETPKASVLAALS